MYSPLSIIHRSALRVSILFGLMYLAIGLAWIVAPAVAARALGASLASGTRGGSKLGLRVMSFGGRS